MMKNYFHFSYAKSVGAHHFHTSAKRNQGIEELFLDLTQQMIQTSDKGGGNGNNPLSGGPTSGASSRRGGSITVVEDSQIPKAKSNCCGGGGDASVVQGLPVDNNLAASSQ